MPSNIAYDSTGDANDTDRRATSGDGDATGGAISTIAVNNRVQADEGTLLTVNTADTYFADEKIHIPDVDKVCIKFIFNFYLNI